MQKAKIAKVWVDEEGVYATTEDGRTAGYKFTQWKRLREATSQQRADFYLSYCGIHWPRIDEDLSFEGMFAEAGLCERTATEDSIYWEAPSQQYPATEEGSVPCVAEG